MYVNMRYMQLRCLMLCTSILFITAGANKVPAVIVFGDSSVDAGNNNNILTVLKSNFPPYGRDLMGGMPTGRFSNGRIPPDFISEAFGLKPLVPAYLDPNYNISDFATGVCFASAGTGYDSATSDVLVTYPVFTFSPVKDLDEIMHTNAFHACLNENPKIVRTNAKNLEASMPSSVLIVKTYKVNCIFFG